MGDCQIGVIGLGVMGQNLARNIARHGFAVAVYNRSESRTREFAARFGPEGTFTAARTPQEFLAALAPPRKVLMMIQAGPPVDEQIEQLLPDLEAGDILIDGGNSYYEDTRRRGQALAARGVGWIGSGVSGGEEGALWGPSLMPGGPREAYLAIEPIWNRIAAQTDDGPCSTYIGEDGAGHFVKMVHNGIEYGDMQLIAEAYDLLRTVGGLQAPALAEVFERWNAGPLQSFLIEITAKIFRKLDPETGRPLVELVLDQAEQKGTGRWTAEVALRLGVPAPTLASAVDARVLSALRAERVAAARLYSGRRAAGRKKPPAGWLDAVGQALYASKICAYAQGMALLRAAAAEYRWSLNLAEISRIWKAGCIIRARFLDGIKAAYRRQPELPNLLLDPDFSRWVAEAAPAWRRVAQSGSAAGVPLLAMGSALAYFDSYRRDQLPQNLTQAQRDFFGAHGYRRADRPQAGPVHSAWE